MTSRTDFESDGRSAISVASVSLRLAAAPVFAIMAILAGIHNSDMPAMVCSATQDASLFAGMVPMYVAMSIFHSPPWLNLLSISLGNTSRRRSS